MIRLIRWIDSGNGNRYAPRSLTLLLAMQCCASLLHAAGEDAKKSDGSPWTTMFDGKTLEGWEGNTKIFRVEDGAIVGGTMKANVPHNDFLSYKKEFGDFEMTLKVKIKGNGNGGIQLRSVRTSKPDYEMSGYQADMGWTFWGALYDESRRNKALVQPDKELIDRILKKEDWNDYRIRCEGPHIQLWLNGEKTVDYTEPDDAIPRKGLIAVQIHGGTPSETWYKEIKIRALP